MPVTINIPARKLPKRGNRAQPLIRRVREIAPIMRDLRAAGVLTVADMAGALNDRGVLNAAGREWSIATMHLALKTAENLWLGVGPQTAEQSRRTRRGWNRAAANRLVRP
jgi:hypothetical protein